MWQFIAALFSIPNRTERPRKVQALSGRLFGTHFNNGRIAFVRSSI
jgi:hypothetical protein